MSKIKIQGNASGTGVVTLTAPNTNTDRTITLPDSTSTLLETNGNGSSLTSLTGSQVDSGQTTAKAWVNFNGTGTVAIRDSHNVSSITDIGTGNYTVNFTNNFANNDYCVSGVASDTSILTIRANDLYHLVSSIQLITRYPITAAVQDSGYTYLQVFGD